MNNKFHPWIALILLTALNLLNYIDRSILFAVQPLVQAEFHRSNAAFGSVTTAFFLVYMFAAPVMGPLADRYSRKHIIVIGAIVWSAATLLTAVTTNFTTLLVRHTIIGIGEASFVTIAPTFVVDLFPEEKRGRVLGFFYLAIPVGTALGYILGGQMGPVYGWRAPFYVSAAPGFLLALSILFLREPERGRQDSLKETPDRATLIGLARNPAFWTATLGMAAMVFAQGALSVWMPTFLSVERGMSLGQANLIFGIVMAVDGILAALLGGWCGDMLLRRFHSAYYLVSGISLALGVPVMIVALRGPRAVMISAIALGGFLLLFNTAPLNAALINSVGAHIRATAIAANIFIIHLLGDAASPWIVGRMADRSSLATGLMTTPIAIAISAAICFLGTRYAPPLRVSADSGSDGSAGTGGGARASTL